MPGADSAGVPWEGRAFEPNSHTADDGSAPAPLMEAIRAFHSGEVGPDAVVDAVRQSRLLIPLVAELGEEGTSDAGHRVDKSQELSIVTVAGPDGRTVLLAFTSVDAMAKWNPKARPIPAAATRVALAAVHEETDLVVIDAMSPSEFALRRPAVWAVARGDAWLPSYLDEQVLAEFVAAAQPEADVVFVELIAGDPDARLAGPELVVRLTLTPGLDRTALDAVTERMQQRWAASSLIAERVDSLRVQFV